MFRIRPSFRMAFDSTMCLSILLKSFSLVPAVVVGDSRTADCQDRCRSSPPLLLAIPGLLSGDGDSRMVCIPAKVVCCVGC